MDSGILESKKKEQLTSGREAVECPGLFFHINLPPSGEAWVLCFDEAHGKFGVPAGERLTPEEFLSCAAAEDVQGALSSLKEALLKLAPWRAKFRVSMDGGALRWVELTSLPTKGEGGEYVWHGHMADITEKLALEERLKDQYELQRQLFETIPVPLVLKDLSSRFTLVNEAFADFVNLPMEEVVGRDAFGVFTPDVARKIMDEDREIIAAGRTMYDLERQVQDGRGRIIWLKSYKGPIRNSRGEIVGVMGGNMDISEVKDTAEALRESEARWKFALEGAGAGVWDLNARTGEIFFSNQWKAFLGYGENEIEASMDAWKGLVHPEDRDRAFRYLEDFQARGTDVFAVEYRMRRKDGKWAWVMNRGKIIEFDDDGCPLRIIGTNTDISDLKAREKIYFHQATHDPLTSLANRALFMDRLAMALADARRCGMKVGVAYMDLDDFKQINDELGHAAGDGLLVQLSGRMEALLRETDTLARMGGDEFTFLFPLVEEEEEVKVVLRRVIKALQAPFVVEGKSLEITACVGVAVFPEDGADGSALLRRADAAMYEAKRAGKDRLWSFRDSEKF
ncbi:MAG: diguanylate cyclase [Synergistaceae bacterium]|nr:diguanylate cyclase [Synergistaceae bacterium]